MREIKVDVRHRLGGELRRTVRTYPLPENISAVNVDSFAAAMVENTAAIHQEENFGQPDRLAVDALRRQVLTGILNDALEGPGRRVAARALAVLLLSDGQLLEAHANSPRRGPNGG